MSEPKSRLVEVFPPPASDGCQSASPVCSLACDHCRKGPATDSPRLTVVKLRDLVAAEYVDSVELLLADYSTPTARSETVSALNRLLEDAGKQIRVTAEGLDEFLTQAAPIVAVDGRIVSIIVMPTRGQLESILGSERDSV